MSVCVLVAAAGSGKRMGMSKNKAHLLLKGKPILIHTLSVFETCESVDEIIVIASPEEVNFTYDLIQFWDVNSKVKKVVCGGLTRQESIFLGLKHVTPECEIVVIHDAARPLVRICTIEAVIQAAYKYGAAIAAVPVRDTIKMIEDDYISCTLNRDSLRAARTPQAFQHKLIQDAHMNAVKEFFSATDDSMLIERKGIKVHIIDDELDNIKITYPFDLAVAESYLSNTSTNIIPESKKNQGKICYQGSQGQGFRVGIGFDVHRLVEGRPLILGGVKIPFELGLEGHSDADVIFHAIADAILGGCACGDIGVIFPPDDPSYEGISSSIILSHVRQIAKAQGYNVCNVDVTVIAERPNICKFTKEMKQNISYILKINPRDVNIKATTMEGLGFIGAGKGIACLSSCSLALGSMLPDVGR